MALILNIETSADVCSVALGQDNIILDLLESQEIRDHARVLTLLIDDILKKNHLNIGSLDAVAVSKGPGSYTGLRIGVSTAKGLAYGLDIPLLAVSTLQALANGVLRAGIAGLSDKEQSGMWSCPVIDARRMEVYRAFFDNTGKQVTEVTTEVVDRHSFRDILEKRKILFFGTGVGKCRQVLKHKNAFFLERIYPKADYMVPLSQELFLRNAFEDVAYFEPFYLKEFVATTPRNRLIPKEEHN